MDTKIQISVEKLIKVISDCIDDDKDLKIKELEKTISGLNYELEEAKDELEDAEFYYKKLDKLENKNSILEYELDELKNRSPKNLYDDQKWQILDELFVKYNLEQLKNIIETNPNTISSIIDDLNDQIDEKDEEINDLENKVWELTHEIKDYKVEIDDLENNVHNLELKVEELEG